MSPPPDRLADLAIGHLFGFYAYDLPARRCRLALSSPGFVAHQDVERPSSSGPLLLGDQPGFVKRASRLLAIFASNPATAFRQLPVQLLKSI
jgi:hypothetical protein